MSRQKEQSINLQEIVQSLMLASIENQKMAMHSIDNCVCKKDELEIINEEWAKLEKAVKLLDQKYGKLN